MKIYLADLVHYGALGDNQISGGDDYIVPLNIASIAEYTESQLGSAVEIILFKYLDDLMEALDREPSAILGLSNYVWNIDINEKAIEYAVGIEQNPVIVMGGPAISPNPSQIKEFLNDKSGLDAHIILEGERPFLGLVKAYQQEGPNFLKAECDIPGCAYLRDGELIYTPLTQEGSIAELSSPYLSGRLDEYLANGLIPLFESNRGCPFKCTFCAWGLSALNKVRKFSLERVFAEMEYCATKFPELTSWIVADANFGMLKRDIEIAQKLKDIKSRTPHLQNILIWESKNTSERNIEITKLIGNDLGNVLIAVQTLDEQSQKFVKRDNIHLDDVPRKIDLFHSSGALVETHVLSGLPGETYEGHIETLRKCFNFEFDFINVFSTLLVKGSEMEFAESQELYNIGTKYRLREGSYGDYHGVKSIECEQIIRSNSTISEQEMLSLRPVHWLVWYGWNHGFLKPILKYLQKNSGQNPIDVILKIANGDKTGHPKVKAFFNDFLIAAKSEWFDTTEDFKNHYLKQEAWDDLLENGYSKVEFHFNARMILNQSDFDALLEYIIDFLKTDIPTKDLDQIAKLLRALRVQPQKINNGYIPIYQHFTLSGKIAECFIDGIHIDQIEPTRNIEICLKKSMPDQDKIKASLRKFRFENDPLYAVRKTLGVHLSAFTYEVALLSE